LLTISQAWLFQKGINTFKTLIERLNQMKVDAQLNEQPVLRNIAKLMMNSMYGRFGMHVDEEVTTFMDELGVGAIAAQSTITSSIKIGGLYLVSFLPTAPLGDQVEGQKRVKVSRPMETNVPIAAAVTAYSRMIINELKLVALKEGHQLYYSDTDSLVVSGELPPQYLDPAVLGKLKLEHVLEEGWGALISNERVECIGVVYHNPVMVIATSRWVVVNSISPLGGCCSFALALSFLIYPLSYCLHSEPFLGLEAAMRKRPPLARPCWRSHVRLGKGDAEVNHEGLPAADEIKGSTSR
jgi:hypothetical protein